MRYTARHAVAAALAATLALSLAACGPSDGNGDEAEQTLRVGRTSDITSTSAFETPATNHAVTDLLYDPLVKVQPDGSVALALAEALEWNDDYTEMTVTLRDGVVFHDGEPLTSADVVYSIERWRSGELSGPVTGMVGVISDVTAPDESTVVLSFSTPSPVFTDTLNQIYIARDGDDASSSNGTGAYVLDDWSQGSTIALTRFDDYWDDEVDGVENIEFKILPDAQALAINLESGAIDVAEGLRKRDAARLADTDDFDLTSFTRFVDYITFNVDQAPFDDARVRQAISYAIDRERIVDEILSGIGRATSWPWPPDSALWDEERANAYPFDLDVAAELLDEAGVDGLEVTLTTPSDQPQIGEFAQIIQADLAKIGVELSISNLDVVQWRESATTLQGWDGMLAGPAGRVNVDPVTALLARPYHPSANTAGFRDDAYTALVDSALNEADPQTRFGIVREAGVIVQEQAFTIPVVTSEATMTYRVGVDGLGWRQDLGPVLKDVHLTD